MEDILKILVIHPKDATTDFLSVIYEGRNWTVITENLNRLEVEKQIKLHDRILMLGHGTEYGLIGDFKLVIDEDFAPLLQNKDCIFIWCNADIFVKKHNLKGFYTGMIISEFDEALANKIIPTEDMIIDSNTLFAIALKDAVFKEDMIGEITKKYVSNYSNSIVGFNRDMLYQIK